MINGRMVAPDGLEYIEVVSKRSGFTKTRSSSHSIFEHNLVLLKINEDTIDNKFLRHVGHQEHANGHKKS